MNPNLAGVPREVAETQCRLELEAAGVPLRIDDDNVGVDVKSRVGGELAGVLFRRAWYYWVATGRVPLAVAEKLFAAKEGWDCRVDGDCGCPSPTGRHVHWWLPGGIEVLPTYELDDALGCLKHPLGTMAELARRLVARHVFSDDPASLGASPFVELYHIDSPVGLKAFAEAIRAPKNSP